MKNIWIIFSTIFLLFITACEGQENIQVESDISVEKVEVISLGDNIYEINTTIDLANYKLRIYYSNQTTNEVEIDSDMCSIINLTTLGEQIIDVVYYENGKEYVANFTVDVYDEWDYYDYISEKQEREDIETIKSELLLSIPTVTDEKIKLPLASDYNYKYALKWLSNNKNVLSHSGVVNRKKEDTTVTLNLTISGKYVTEKMSFEIIVLGKGEANLKDIDNGNKLVFAYLSESNYVKITEEDAQSIDVINYCFGRVIDGKLYSNLSHIQELQELRYKYGVRLVLSISNYRTDDGYFGGFGPACQTKTSRKVLIDSIMQYLIENDLDGVDLDWEYPGWSGLEDSSSNDKKNFTLLCQELREALDNYKPGMLLTAAVIGGLNETGISKFYDVSGLNESLDYFHLMTYDLNSSSTASHHTNLYSGTRGYSTENSIKRYLSLGASKKKIVIGAAFYGKISELSVSTTNLESVYDKSVKSTETITYTTISKKYLNNSEYKVLYDSANGAHYITNGTYFITYDSRETIILKVDMIDKYDIGGIMFWDYGSDETGELISALTNRINYINK